MPPSLTPLDRIRQEIDRIDDQIHDLLMRRAERVGTIRAAKPPGMPVIRPAREHMVLKRLIERHEGDLPRATIVAIWREIMGAFAHLQGADTVSAPAALQGVARAHYGATMRYIVKNDAAALLASVVSGEAVLGILPWPGEHDSWWVDVVAMKRRPTLVASLPFLTNGAPEALAFAMIDAEPTGDDCSLIVHKARGAVPFAGVKPIAAKNGLRLIEVPEFMAPDDARLTHAEGMVLLGCYAKSDMPSLREA